MDSLPHTLSSSEEALFLQTMPTVKAVVSSIWRGLPCYADFDDLMQAGSMGLLDAVRRFDPSRGVPFAAYAKFRIRGAVLDSLRQLDELGRADRRRVKEQRAIAERSPEESVGENVRPKDEYVLPMLGRVAARVGSAQDKNDSEDWTIDPRSNDHTPEQLYENRVVKELLGETICDLPARYQQVITLYYEGDVTMREIGRMLGVNESRISQIHKSALTKMAAALATRGLASGDLISSRACA